MQKQLGISLPARGFATRSEATVRILLLCTTFALSFFALNLQAAWATERAVAPAVHLQLVAGGLSAPVDFQPSPDSTGRFFIVEQGGTIRILKGSKFFPTPFLNISSILVSGGETGLLGLAFHPAYKTNGRFFVNYTRRKSGKLQTVIAEYHVSSDPNVADPSSGKVILVVDQPFDNHNGGQIAFGFDGFLYIGLGDGGSGGDPLGNGQRLSTLLGKMLRLDINSTAPYAIPPDNPFVGTTGARGEIWAYGLRNPWRFSFDKPSNRLYIADVGQGDWEEIDLGTKGGNFGWVVMEGKHCYPPGSNCNQTGLTLPIAEYSHAEGAAVIGGYVYRGTKIPALKGLYIFGDFSSGQIWMLQETTPNVWQRTPLLASGLLMSAFGRAPGGELFVLDYGSGAVYKLVAG